MAGTTSCGITFIAASGTTTKIRTTWTMSSAVNPASRVSS